ncbi:MAG: helix-turn-helix domain-containing protein [Planctomycetota bacterium]|nr:helix-turn-helix domain-containing protein [Planctomycetota bacterium]
MVVSEQLLKTQQVASALGVSVSTVKRWVDSGRLEAARTIGKHRLIRPSDALRLASELNLAVDVLEPLRTTPTPASIGTEVEAGTTSVATTPTAIDDNTRAALFEALRTGETSAARAIVRGVWESGAGAAALGDNLIRPVFERIGQGWMTGTLDVYQEHEASHVMLSTLSELADQAARRTLKAAPLAFGAAPEGDPYVLAGLLGELTLRDIGWNVRNLGVNLPLRSIAKAVEHHHPSLLFVTVNYLVDPDHFVNEFKHLTRAASRTHTAVVVGGRALSPAIRARIAFDAWGERLTDLSDFARRLIPGLLPVTSGRERVERVINEDL